MSQLRGINNKTCIEKQRVYLEKENFEIEVYCLIVSHWIYNFCYYSKGDILKDKTSIDLRINLLVEANLVDNETKSVYEWKVR